MDKKFAIFDMDGTLVDSMGYWHRLEREFLSGKGLDEADIDRVLEETTPMTVEESAALFCRRFGLRLTPEELIGEMMEVMEGHYRRDVELKPGALAYLEGLKARGVKMCCATATPAPLARICLERNGLDRYFSFLLSCMDVGAGKNRPDIFLESARRLGCTPEEAAVFEDSIYAVTTARRAGFYVVGIYDTHAAPRWEEVQALSHETVADWRDVT